MRKHVKSACVFLGVFLTAASLSWRLYAEDLPDYMKGLVSVMNSTPADTANANLLVLNVAMFDLYDTAGQTFTKNILASHPVILALFSGRAVTSRCISPVRRR